MSIVLKYNYKYEPNYELVYKQIYTDVSKYYYDVLSVRSSWAFKSRLHWKKFVFIWWYEFDRRLHPVIKQSMDLMLQYQHELEFYGYIKIDTFAEEREEIFDKYAPSMGKAVKFLKAYF